MSRVSSPERQRVVVAACKKFPRLSHKALSQKLLDEHPQLFEDESVADNAVRYCRGVRGPESMRYAKARGTYRQPQLPKSLSKPWDLFHLHHRRVLGLGDIHIPFHDEVAVKAAIDYGRDYKPDAILLNGDVLDFAGISKFARDPRGPTVREELDTCSDFLDWLRASFPGVPIYWKLGNHEERWERMLWSKAAEILDIAEFAWEKWAGVHANHVTMIRDKRIVMVGKLPVLHGHELPKGMMSPVNPARGAFLRLFHSALVNHWHTQSEHNEINMFGHVFGTRSSGCLCNLRPEYARFNKWTSGFFTVTVAKDGSYECDLKKIIDGKVY